MNTLPHVSPVAARERIASIDVLRGFALLGILLLNIQAFSMIFEAYGNPTAYGDLNGANYQVWFFTHLLGDQKFMSIFSMLFGAGIVLMTTHVAGTGGGAAGFHYRRMAWLLLIGLVHAYILWWGDILVSYALAGMLVYPLRRLPVGWALGIGAVLFLVPMTCIGGLGAMAQMLSPEELVEWRAGFQPSAEAVDLQVQAYRGTWLDQMPYRAMMAAMLQFIMFPLFIMWRVCGLMLIGMACYRLGVFSAARSTRVYGAMFAAGLFFGLPLVWLGIALNESNGWKAEFAQTLGAMPNYIGSVFVSFAWIALVMLLCKSGVLSPVRAALAAVGRMALTNYLLQTIVCTLLFYGHGLGWFGHVERTGQLQIVVVIWIAQLIASPIWLRFFRFGPAEWVWRSLTYWSLQPMRRAAIAPAG